MTALPQPSWSSQSKLFIDFGLLRVREYSGLNLFCFKNDKNSISYLKNYWGSVKALWVIVQGRVGHHLYELINSEKFEKKIFQVWVNSWGVRVPVMRLKFVKSKIYYFWFFHLLQMNRYVNSFSQTPPSIWIFVKEYLRPSRSVVLSTTWSKYRTNEYGAEHQ